MVHHYRIIALSRFYSFHLPREREFFSILIFRLARNNRIISSFVGSEFDSHRGSIKFSNRFRCTEKTDGHLENGSRDFRYALYIVQRFIAVIQ